MMNNSAKTEIMAAIAKGELLRAVFSDPFVKESAKVHKLEIRPLLVKDTLNYQITEYIAEKAFHQNFEPTTCQKIFFDQILNFKQVLVSLKTTDYQILTNKKGAATFLKKAPQTKKLEILPHNRKKNYLLENELSLPLLIELGLKTKTNQVIAKKYDKYRQLNRFLEMVDDILPHLDQKKRLHIVDFGCGRAYLTFALYHYLHEIKGYDITITGLDLKEDVVKSCQLLAGKLQFQHLHFLVADVNRYETKEPVDLMMTLHLCDTATDAALEKAILWKVKVILSVPCCQHELITQVENKALSPLLKQGILKEKFSSLVTDAARAQILEIMGYQTQVLEFIDMEHTPKNLLIRAVKREKNPNRKELIEAYLAFKKELNIYPTLEKKLEQYF